MWWELVRSSEVACLNDDGKEKYVVYQHHVQNYGELVRTYDGPSTR